MSRFAELLGSADFDGEIIRNDISERAIRPRAPRMAPSEQPPLETDFFLVALQILRKRKFTIIGFFLLVVQLVLLGSVVMKPKYEAVSRIVFNRENANPLGFKDLGDGPPEDAEYSVALETQVQILQSDTLAVQVIRELHLDHNPAFLGKAPVAAAGNESTSVTAPRALVGSFRNGLSV